MVRAASLCAGIGGLDLILESFGHEIAWHAEYDTAPSKVLAHHWPGVPNIGDITTANWKEVEQMDRRRNDELAQSMYDRYCQGLSCAQVAEEFGRSRQTVWKMFTRRGWSTHERPPARPSIEFNGRTYSLRNTGYYGATDGGRESLHRDVWEFHNGPLESSHDVHHIDHDKTNNDITNLEAMPKDEHTRRHHAERGGDAIDSERIDILTAGYP